MTPVAVSHFSAPMQQVYAVNELRVRGKPYAKFFTGQMFLPPQAVAGLRQPMPLRDAVRPDELSRLLDPTDSGAHTGYCVLPGGTAYVAGRTVFPDATADMLAWWFWWFMVERERYALWHPYSHVRADPVDASSLVTPGLTDEQRYVGITLRGVEYIGARRHSVTTRFVSPEAWGLRRDALADGGVAASVQGEILLGPLRVGRMLRLARNTDAGFELDTRFWIGDTITVGSAGPNIAPALRRLGLKGRLIDASTAYDQLFKDQVAMTHLASFLPEVHHQFG